MNLSFSDLQLGQQVAALASRVRARSQEASALDERPGLDHYPGHGGLLVDTKDRFVSRTINEFNGSLSSFTFKAKQSFQDESGQKVEAGTCASYSGAGYYEEYKEELPAADGVRKEHAWIHRHDGGVQFCDGTGDAREISKKTYKVTQATALMIDKIEGQMKRFTAWDEIPGQDQALKQPGRVYFEEPGCKIELRNDHTGKPERFQFDVSSDQKGADGSVAMRAGTMSHYSRDAVTEVYQHRVPNGDGYTSQIAVLNHQQKSISFREYAG